MIKPPSLRCRNDQTAGARACSPPMTTLPLAFSRACRICLRSKNGSNKWLPPRKTHRVWQKRRANMVWLYIQYNIYTYIYITYIHITYIHITYIHITYIHITYIYIYIIYIFYRRICVCVMFFPPKWGAHLRLGNIDCRFWIVVGPIIWALHGFVQQHLGKTVKNISGWWFQPLWKIWLHQLGVWNSQPNGKIIQMFQTTNQSKSMKTR